MGHFSAETRLSPGQLSAAINNDPAVRRFVFVEGHIRSCRGLSDILCGRPVVVRLRTARRRSRRICSWPRPTRAAVASPTTRLSAPSAVWPLAARLGCSAAPIAAVSAPSSSTPSSRPPGSLMSIRRLGSTTSSPSSPTIPLPGWTSCCPGTGDSHRPRSPLEPRYAAAPAGWVR